MKHYLLEGEITEQALRDLSHFFNENEGSEITVFLDSNGGLTSYADAISMVIDAHKSPVKLVAINTIKSAGAQIFFGVSCERVVMHGTTGLVHCAGRRVRLVHNGYVPDQIERFDQLELERDIERDVEFWRTAGLSEENVRVFKSGADVLLTKSDIEMMIVRQQINRSERLKSKK